MTISDFVLYSSGVKNQHKIYETNKTAYRNIWL